MWRAKEPNRSDRKHNVRLDILRKWKRTLHSRIRLIRLPIRLEKIKQKKEGKRKKSAYLRCPMEPYTGAEWRKETHGQIQSDGEESGVRLAYLGTTPSAPPPILPHGAVVASDYAARRCPASSCWNSEYPCPPEEGGGGSPVALTGEGGKTEGGRGKGRGRGIIRFFHKKKRNYRYDTWHLAKY